MIKFSLKWKSSKKPRKQRKYRSQAPLHIKGKFLHANLSKELRIKYGLRSLRIIKGDKVKIMVGDDKKKEGIIEKVNLKKSKIFIQGIVNSRKDGNKVQKPIEPSNVMIIEVKTDDKKRFKRLKNLNKEEKIKPIFQEKINIKNKQKN